VSATVLIVRLCLATVFGVAATAKLADLGRTRESLAAFGVPRGAAAPAAVALPGAELAVALLLVPAATVRGGALAALALLLVFSAAVGRALLRREQPGCNCFGAVHSRPVGHRTLARNAALAAVALGVALAGPGKGLAAPPATVAVAFALVAALAGQAWLSVQVFRQNGRLLERVRALEQRGGDGRAELAPGDPAPWFARADLDGERGSLDELLGPGLPLALVFVDPGCPACDTITRRLAELRDERLSAARVLVHEERELAASYHVHAVPSAILIGPDGLIASTLATGSDAIDALLARVAPPRVAVAV
jgi:hypothetical protein